MISTQSRCGLIKDLYAVINDFLGNRLRGIPIDLLTFLKVISRCSLKSKD